ncbi:MAG: hypothetical protein A2104_01560 [Candidatus Melainabacteria bacterium GWF2_32_7]|nr:MAG: hypothetical protein A2104_01560 [Candidatus Melainabacteria bacterium GWF2_32_7]
MKDNPINTEKPMFPISVIADILNVHPRTLRIYDEEKILSPKRTPKNRRLYSLNDIEKGKFIQFLTKNNGVNLAGIKIIIKLLKKLKVSPENYINIVATK